MFTPLVPVKKIGRNQNKYDETNAPDPIPLNTATWTMVLDDNPERLGYRVSNDSASDVYVLEQSVAPGNNTPRGVILWKKAVGTSMPDNPHTGKVWMLAKNGTPSIIVDELNFNVS